MAASEEKSPLSPSSPRKGRAGKEGPEVPPTVISFKLDQHSGHAYLEQESLRSLLKNINQFALDLHSEALTEIREDLHAQVEILKGEMRVSLEEAKYEVESALRKRIDDVEESGQKAIDRATAAELAAKKAAEQAAEAGRARAAVVEQVEDEEEDPTSPAGGGPKSPGGKAGGGGGGGGGSGEPPPGYEDALKDIEENKFELKRLDTEIKNQAFALTRKIERVDTKSDETITKINEMLQVQKTLEEKTQELRVKESDIQQELERLETDKANNEDLNAIPAELERLRRTAAGAQKDIQSTITPQLEKCEAAIQSFETFRSKVREATEFTAKNVESMRTTVNACATQSEAAAKRAEGSERAMSELGHQMASKCNDLDARLAALSQVAEVISTKASTDDVGILKEAVSLLARHDKEREQAVLFGARCLSCNRVYDDVEREPGAVDLQCEKQKTHLFAQVQKALNNPSSDFSKPIKLISVKVGRQQATTGGDGVGKFNTRDGAFGYALDDVQLLLRGWKEGGLDAQRPSTVEGSRMISEPSRPKGPSSGRPNSVASGTKGLPGMMSTVPSGVPDIPYREGPLDYKKPLAGLLGGSRQSQSGMSRSQQRTSSKFEDPDNSPWSAKPGQLGSERERFPASGRSTSHR